MKELPVQPAQLAPLPHSMDAFVKSSLNLGPRFLSYLAVQQREGWERVTKALTHCDTSSLPRRRFQGSSYFFPPLLGRDEIRTPLKSPAQEAMIPPASQASRLPITRTFQGNRTACKESSTQYDHHCSIRLAEFNMSTILFLLIRSLQILSSSAYSFAVLCSPLWLMFVLYEFLGRRSFIDPICCNFCMVLSMFFRLVLANSLFSLRDINLTLGLLPPRRHVV